MTSTPFSQSVDFLAREYVGRTISLLRGDVAIRVLALVYGTTVDTVVAEVGRRMTAIEDIRKRYG